jgi:hypothetical protein
MPSRTAIFRRADSSQKAKCKRNTSFTDLYFTKPEFSAIFFGLPVCKNWQKFENIFDGKRKWG